MNRFSKMNLNDLQFDPVRMIGHEWMLITAGDESQCNTMTASWGGTGYLWNKPVVFIFVRPQRFTFKFTEEQPIFTCSFFDREHRKALQYCGAHSGRDMDKIKAAGLTLMQTPEGAFTFEQADIFLVCKKLYYQDLSADGVVDASVLQHYPENDFHRMYVGEIISASARIKK